MKKLIILLVAVGLVLFLVGNRESSNIDNPQEEELSFKPDPANATFIFEEGPITLSQGKYTASLIPGSAVSEETFLTSIRGHGDINGDKKNDTVAVLVQSGGASGVFIYLGGYVSGPVSYKGTNAVFLGDRITPESILIDRGRITVTYLDREEGEPFAAEPSVSVSKNFFYRDGLLVEE